MSVPVNPSTDKVRQSYFPLSLRPSNEDEFPIAYGDNLWDVVPSGSPIAALAGNTGQFDQHSINELMARSIILLQQFTNSVWLPISGQYDHPADFSDDFANDFDY